jgi:APA family basic amino acid/polyamine antiporter
MTELTGVTWLRFGIWMIVGLAVYFLYSRTRSAVAQRAADREAAEPGP